MSLRPRVPEPVGPHAEFYEHAASGVLHLQRCRECGRYQQPPRYRCPGCGGDSLEWHPSGGTGVLYSWTVTHRVVDRGWSDTPYATGVIELDEGVRLVGALSVPREARVLGLPLAVALAPMTDTFVFLTLERR